MYSDFHMHKNAFIEGPCSGLCFAQHGGLSFIEGPCSGMYSDFHMHKNAFIEGPCSGMYSHMHKNAWEGRANGEMGFLSRRGIKKRRDYEWGNYGDNCVVNRGLEIRLRVIFYFL